MIFFRRWVRHKFKRAVSRRTKLNLELLEDRLTPTTPSVLSIGYESPVSPSTSASSVEYAVSFSEPVNGVAAGDFRIVTTGATHAAAPVVLSGSGSAYNVTVNGIHGSGALQLDLIDNDSITSQSSGTPLGGTGAGNGSYEGQTYSILQAAPYVVSINGASPANLTTTASSVSYTVTFSAAVTGVTASAFHVVTTGTVTAGTPQVSPVSGSVYTVAVSGISGSGTLGLNLVDNNTIHDLAGNPLVQPNAPASFQNQATVATPPRPISLVAADLNGDGIPDLAVANENGSSIGVLLGNGNGTFQAQHTYGVGAYSYSVAVGDVNGDGVPDLVVATSYNVSVLLGNGNGTFQAPVSFAAGTQPFAVAVENLTGDGKADLIVANRNSNNISVLLGNGDGTFQAQQTYAVGSSPEALALADLSGDGIEDVLVANARGGGVGVLMGNGNGTFQAQQTFAVGSFPVALAVADLNGDGKLDVVAANQFGSGVSVLMGNGNGTFQTQHVVTTDTTPDSVVIGDINGDGKEDLVVVSSQSSGRLDVLLGNGDGTFQTPTTLAVGNLPYSAALSDLNGDGRPDLVVANYDANAVGVLLSSGNGNFTGQVYTIVGPPTSAVSLLPVATTTTSFTVSWSGNDNGGGNSIVSYSVYVSDNGGPFTPFLTGTTLTSATFNGVFGHTYGFYSVCTDSGSNVQPTPTSAQASTAVLLPLAGSITASHGAAPVPISLNSLDPTPTGAVSYTVTFADPLLTLKNTYGLSLQDGYFNYRNRSEKYFKSTNGSNSAGNGFYVLMPTGNLYTYVPDAANDLNATLAVAPVGTVPISVYANPALLAGNTGLPIATAGTNSLYDLKIQYGLVTAPTFNKFGADEYEFQSSNNSNKAGGGLYVLMPDNKLYASGASLAVNQLVADFNLAPYSTNVYANRALLTGAVLPTAVGVAAATSSANGGELTLTPIAGFDRSVSITVKATDSIQSHAQAFTYTVSNATPSIATLGNVAANSNATVPTVTLGVTDPNPDAASRSYTVSVAGYNPLFDVQTQYGLTAPDLTKDFSFRHQDEKYFQSTNGSNAGANAGYYVLMPTDKLYAYVKDAANDLSATLANPPVADFTKAPYSATGNVYNTTALLYNAAAPTSPTVASNSGPLYDLQTQLGLTIAVNPATINKSGVYDEKYLLSANGSNPAGGGQYVLLPSNKLYAYDGLSVATSIANAPVADFTLPQYAAAGNIWAEPSLITAVHPVFNNNPVFNVKQTYGLNTADSNFNYRGGQEKYLKSANGSNAANGGWYVLMPTDKLYVYVKDAANDLVATLAQQAVFDFTPYGNVYAVPALLYASTGQTAAVTAVISAGGVITLTPSARFVGTVRITATVSDGAEKGVKSFLFAVADSAPTLAPINNITVASTAGAVNVGFSATVANGAAVLHAASVAGYNPLYDEQQLYGLTAPSSRRLPKGS